MNFKYLYHFLVLSLFLSSCASFEDLLLLNQGEAFPTEPEYIDNKQLPTIQPNDVLYIQVEADDLEGIAAQPFNKSIGMIGGGGGGNMLELSGYLVDTAGQIEFPILGIIEVGGKTTSEARAVIKDKLLPYIKAPIVNIRFLNFRVNIMGEVGAPGIITTTNERLTIMEVLTQAGGITPVGNATNILIVREKRNQRTYGRINLQDRAVFNSP
ncbi:MAG: polysaccharide biosynthesis/export family protein, partial [Bacteroidota bacterium]